MKKYYRNPDLSNFRTISDWILQCINAGERKKKGCGERLQVTGDKRDMVTKCKCKIFDWTLNEKKKKAVGVF